jgi:hypothetical protein
METAKRKILKVWKAFKVSGVVCSAATKIGQAWRRSKRGRRARLKAVELHKLRPEAEEFRASAATSTRRHIKYFNPPMEQYELPAEHKPETSLTERLKAAAAAMRRETEEILLERDLMRCEAEATAAAEAAAAAAAATATAAAAAKTALAAASGSADQRALSPAARPWVQRNSRNFLPPKPQVRNLPGCTANRGKRRVKASRSQQHRRKVISEYRKVRGDPTGRHTAMRRMKEKGDLEGMKKLKLSAMKAVERMIGKARNDKGRAKREHQAAADLVLHKLLVDNGLRTTEKSPAGGKCILDLCKVHVDPRLMRKVEKRTGKGLSDAKLGKLRHGLAEMWESVRIGASEDTRGKELWRGMLQLFHNLEGVDYGREHLEDADSDSESDCSYSDSETDGSDSDCEGRFNRFTGEGRW